MTTERWEIEDLFARELPINRGRAAPALGRYRGDSYFGGGAWFDLPRPTRTLGVLAAPGPHHATLLGLARGDAPAATPAR